METFSGLLLDKLLATVSGYILVYKKRARIGQPRSQGEVENQTL